MGPKQIIKNCSGLNTLVDRFQPRNDNELFEAVNVRVSRSGKIERITGYSSIDTTKSHSLFCDGGDAFVMHDRTDDAAIMLIEDNNSLTGVRSGMQKGVRVSFFQVGDKTYYSNGIQNGYIQNGVSFPWPDESSHIGANTTREFYPAPIGTHIAYANSYAWISVGNTVYVSEPYSVGKFNLARRFFQFGFDIIMIKPVVTGMWLSTTRETGFIQFGDKFNNMSWSPQSSIPAHEWSEATPLVDLSQTKLQIVGQSAIWSSNAGICVGGIDGQLRVITMDKLHYLQGSRGATTVSELEIINSVWQ